MKNASRYKQHKLFVLGSSHDLASSLWGDFGDLLRSIVSDPMDGRQTTTTLSDRTIVLSKLFKLSKETDNIVSMTNPDRIRAAFASEKVNIQQRRHNILALASYAFKRAHTYDPEDWYYPFSMASVYSKLGKKSSVCSLMLIFRM